MARLRCNGVDGAGTPGTSRGPPGVVIEAPGHSERVVSVADLRALPATEVTADFVGEHGQQHARYRGVLLWALLESMGVVDASKPRSHVAQVVTTIGQDGYKSVLALAEIAPAFEAKQVILAYDRDATPLGGEYSRLIVPGDRRGARSVRDVVRISLR